MKGRFYIFVLSLFLTFGLAFGQANQDAGGAAGDEPAQEAPADQDAAGQDAAGQEGAPQEEEAEGQDGAVGQDEAAQDGAAGQDGAAQDDAAGQDVGQDDAAGQDAGQEGEEGVAGGGQADMAADQSIIQVLQSNPDFSMFADAVERAGLSTTLEQEGPFTILAPTNQAFQQANIDLANLDQQALTSLVRNHIISGMVSADQLGTLAGVVTLLGTEYAVAPGAGQPVAGAEQQDGQVAGGGAADPAQEGQDQAAEQPGDVDPAQDAAADVPMGQPGADGAVGLAIGEASVTQAGMQATSGVVYGIDTVLVPEGVQGIEGGGAAQPAEPGMDEEPAPGEEGQPAEEPTPEIETPEGDDAGMGDDGGMGDDAGAGDAGMDGAGDAGAGDAGDAGDAGMDGAGDAGAGDAGDAGMDDNNN